MGVKMTKAMIDAALKILSDGLEDKSNMEHYVKCAKNILDSLIKELTPETTPEKLLMPKPKEEIEYLISVENKCLHEIRDPQGREIMGTTKLIINGQHTTYNEAKGKPFQTGRVLG
jgi:hypothetical protein